MRHPHRSITAIVFSLLIGPVAAAANTAAQIGDASIVSNAKTGTWTLSAGGAALTLAADSSRDFALLSLTSPSSDTWVSGSLPDTFVRTTSSSLPLGSRSRGFTFVSATVDTLGTLLRLHIEFALPSSGLRVTRHYAITPGSPTFEVWTSYTSTSQASISDLNAFEMNLPAGTIHYLSGLQGDAANVPHDSAFTLQETTPSVGGHLALGAVGRASEQTVPWFAVDGAHDTFYAALLWSGAWSLGVNRSASELAVTLGLGPMTTVVQDAVEGPHAVFGVARGGLGDATAALRSYVLNGLRQGRPLTALVTYNTWFAYGTEIDEASMRAEMERVAALGVELFVIDAGWYAGTGAAGPFDFDSGLGTWTPDPARFPNGLGALRDYAHSLGLRFGLWVEPERVNLSQVGESDVAEAWLATSGGNYGSDHAGQICLANDDARQWVQDRLTSLLDEVQPDYLKWDNNMWINCDREGHGHGATDANFQHVNALYGMLAELRARYPDMLVENVSGGGNRLDVGMLRYTDTAWMDDRTAPSVNVRHNLEGLSAVFPPAYLLSFVTEHDTEPLHDSPDLSLYFRSRMAGALGLCFRSDGFTEGENASIMREIDIYKSLRGTLDASAGALLTRQAETEDGPAWDVLQESAAGSRQVLLRAFQFDEGVQRINVRPTGLEGSTTYDVISVDNGAIGSATGADLMASGVDLIQSPNSAAHILILRAQEP